MQYDFMIASEEYLENYKDLKTDQKLEQFDYITIVPARRSGEESYAYFVNSDTNECVAFHCEGGGASVALYDSLMADNGDMRYISTGQRTSASVLWRNMFLPQWAYLPYEYPALEQEFAFEKDGEPSRATLENTVKISSAISLWTGASVTRTAPIPSVTAKRLSNTIRMCGFWSITAMKTTPAMTEQACLRVIRFAVIS